LVRILYDEFLASHLPMRAAALTFSILLSMVPILALSTSLFKALGNDQQLKTGIISLIDQWEPIAQDTYHEPLLASPGPPASKTAVLHQAVHLIFAYVDQTNFAALGIFGVFSLLLATFFVFSAIEEALNTIWHAGGQRALHRKIIDYLALLVLLPLSFNLAFALEAVFTSENIMHRLNHIFPNVLVQALLFHVTPFLFIVFTLLLLYLFVPQKRVDPWAALVAAGVAASLWIILQKLYFYLQIGVSNYNIIYGSFASIPLFFVWLYNGWLCILFGSLLSYALQHLRDYQFTSTPLTPRTIIPLAFDILITCYHNFENRVQTPYAALIDVLPTASPHTIQYVLHQLKQGGYVTTVKTSMQTTFVPCVSADQLMASEILFYLLGNSQHMNTSPGEQLTADWFAALQDSTNISIAHLLEEYRL